LNCIVQLQCLSGHCSFCKCRSWYWLVHTRHGRHCTWVTMEKFDKMRGSIVFDRLCYDRAWSVPSKNLCSLPPNQNRIYMSAKLRAKMSSCVFRDLPHGVFGQVWFMVRVLHCGPNKWIIAILPLEFNDDLY
jgi:hypothetical protein